MCILQQFLRSTKSSNRIFKSWLSEPKKGKLNISFLSRGPRGGSRSRRCPWPRRGAQPTGRSPWAARSPRRGGTSPRTAFQEKKHFWIFLLFFARIGRMTPENRRKIFNVWRFAVSFIIQKDFMRKNIATVCRYVCKYNLLMLLLVCWRPQIESADQPLAF